MFIVEALQDFSRKVFGYSNYYELFDGYFSQLKRDEPPSLQGFSLFVRSSKGKNNRTFNVGAIVINVFGLVGAQRLNSVHLPNSTRHLQGGNDSLLQAYSRQLKLMANDVLITLRHNLEDVRKERLSPTLPPLGDKYSWQAKKATSVTAPMDHIRSNLVRFLTLHPFPDRLMKILGMSDIGCVEKAVNKRQENLQQLVRSIFVVLAEPPALPLILPVSDEELLLRNGAFASYFEEEANEDDIRPISRSIVVFSFVDEIVKWTKKYCEAGTIQAWQTTLKVSRLIGVFPPSMTSPRAQSTTIRLSLASRSSFCSSSSQIEDSPFCSFQDFLVERTINKLFSPEIEKGTLIRQQLFSLFKVSESTRVDFLFFWQVLHSLFIELDREIKPSLKSLIDAVLPLSDQFNAYQRVGLVRNRLFPLAVLSQPLEIVSSSSSSISHSIDHSPEGAESERARLIDLFSSVLTIGFIFEHFVVKNIAPEGKVTLIHWLYQRLSGARRANFDFWGVILRSKLPLSCCDELFANRGFVFEEQCFVVAWDLICLFSADKDPHFDLIEPCFSELGFNLGFRSASSGEEELHPIKSKVMRGRDLLRIHHISSDHAKYNLMDSILCLLICKEYMKLSDHVENVLFERLLSVTADCRAKSIEEILQFTKNPNPLVFRERMIHNIWKGKMGEAAFSRYSDPIKWVDFQLNVVQQIELITGHDTPLITLLIVFLYCFYVPIRNGEHGVDTPILVEKLLLLAELRKTSFAEVESLFVSPVQINQIQMLTHCLFDPDTVIPLESYTNEPHRQCLQYHQGGLFGWVQDIFIPTIKFREPFVNLTKALIDRVERRKFPNLQGLVHFGGKELHYHNEISRLATEADEGFDTITHDTYVGEWPSVLYMMRWIEDKGGRLTFELVFWRSMEQLNSRSFQIPFGYSVDELSQILLKPLPKKLEDTSAGESGSQQIQHGRHSLVSVTLDSESPKGSMELSRMHSAPVLRFATKQEPKNSKSRFFMLLNALIESAIELQGEELEEQLQSLANDEEAERLFCLSPLVDALIGEIWATFLEGGEDCERVAKDLFRFVRELKIKTRKALATLNMFSSSLDLSAIEQSFSDEDLPQEGLEQHPARGSPSISRLSLMLPRSSSQIRLLTDLVIDLKEISSSLYYSEGIPLDKEQRASILRILESFAIQCRSSSRMQRESVCKIIGYKGVWGLTLAFDPMRPKGDNASSSYDPGLTASPPTASPSSPSPSLQHLTSNSVEGMEHAPESTNLNEFTALLTLMEPMGASCEMGDSFKLGDLLNHSRAHFLLKWLIDTLYQRYVGEL